MANRATFPFEMRAASQEELSKIQPKRHAHAEAEREHEGDMGVPEGLRRAEEPEAAGGRGRCFHSGLPPQAGGGMSPPSATG